VSHAVAVGGTRVCFHIVYLQHVRVNTVEESGICDHGWVSKTGVQKYLGRKVLSFIRLFIFILLNMKLSTLFLVAASAASTVADDIEVKYYFGSR